MSPTNKKTRHYEEPQNRWTYGQTKEMFDTIIADLNPYEETFETPTAQKYYDKILSKAPKIQHLTWVKLKNKMRHQKSCYLSYVHWMEKKGKSLMAEGKYTEVSNYRDKNCPFYDQLDQIFSHLKHENPIPVEKTEKVLLKVEPDLDLNDTEPADDSMDDHSVGRDDDSNHSDTESETTVPQSTGLEWEKEKCAIEMKLEKQRIELERQKLSVKRYELMQTMEIKKLEVASTERIAIEKLRLEKEVEVRKYELELKYGKPKKK